MAYRIRKEFKFNERLALFIAFEAMQKLNWCSEPGLMVCSLVLIGNGDNIINADVHFPLWDHPETEYVVTIMYGDQGGLGRCKALHCNGELIDLGYFMVTKEDSGRPRVTFDS